MQNPSWNMIEKCISEEIEFLRNNLSPSPFDQNDPIKCNDCVLRLIATLIVSGKVRVNKIYFSQEKIWGAKRSEKQENNFKKHGADWHDGMIGKINSYFISSGHKTHREPNLFFGKADIGVEDPRIYFEVGTVNLYKLYVNLLNVVDSRIIVIPFEDYMIEFCL